MQRFFCDGCNADLTESLPAENEANLALRNSYLSGVPKQFQQIRAGQLSELFCAACRTRAATYWETKAQIMAEVSETLSNRLRKLTANHFKQQPLKAVGK